MTFIDDVKAYAQSGHAGVWVTTHEEVRCARELVEVAKLLKWNLWRWSMTTGWVGQSASGEDKRVETSNPADTLQKVLSLPNDGLFVLFDFHPHFETPLVVRTARDVLSACKQEDQHRMVVFVSPVLAIPVELEKEIVVADFPLPDRASLRNAVDFIVDSAKHPVEVPDKERVVESCLGLSRSEAENALGMAYVRYGHFGPEAIKLLHREKAAMIKKSGLMTFHEPSVTMKSVGGLKALRAWLAEIGLMLGRYEDTLAFGFQPEDVCRGVLLIGPPGCGKTLVGKAAAAEWMWPLLWFKFSRVFGRLMGQSQEQMRMALQMFEAMAPACILLDEADKEAQGIESSGQTDSGTTSQVIGEFLTWYEEHVKPLFVLATANRPWKLPAELVNRFEEVFRVDLPDLEERQDILTIMLQARRQSAVGIDLAQVAGETNGYNGRELRRIVRGGMRPAFLEERALTTADLLAAAVTIKPISETWKEDIDRIREWCTKRNIRSASGEKAGDQGAPTRRLQR